ncbi:hypothetical protein [Desulfuromonas sp. AOP6]|uniref:hypothetical protein n=1 Tax=Desulfuromonas sp. AOP6 TaxID=1566351 RepID=UPI0012746DEA|nr:hypothetical protein [Desulfuromonas sp. AOP6]BCA81002.1 hypothetical protein AOP6_2789 [Desulfuromonas sp. AOP6]
MALNKYLDRTESLIKQYKEVATFEQFQTPTGDYATFDDLIWFYVDPNTGHKTRILTGRHGTKGRGPAGSGADNVLPKPYGDLVKVFIIECFNLSISNRTKTTWVGYARKLLSSMHGHLYQQTPSSIIDCIHGCRVYFVIPFINFCEKHGLVPKNSQRLRSFIKDARDRTGQEADSQRNQKMASEDTIKAIGAVYAKTLNNLINERPEPGDFRDALASFVALLCLAAPNRASAEVPLLPNQKLMSYSEGDRPKVFYMDWPGSKGFQDNRNHILRDLAPLVEKGLDYFSEACQPGRILARYYINPDQKLCTLLGDFPIESERKARLELDKKPHLFQLGYALGFYGIDDEVYVYSEDSSYKKRHCRLKTSDNLSKRTSCWRPKKIADLQTEDLISSNAVKNPARPGLYKLLNCHFQGKYAKKFDPDNNRLITVEKIEGLLFDLHRNSFPSFPFGFSTGGQTQTKMDGALFCVLGYQYYGQGAIRKGGGTPGGSNFYTLLTPASLAQNAARDIGRRGLLFTRRGFSSRLFLNYHQLRHYTNTLADRSGIPNEIITAWSGRKSCEQTYEYIHTSHAERTSRVKEVQATANETTQPIRWVSRDDIEKELNLPASATSTGVCVQNLITSPCDYLNDFISSCFLCPSSCHVAGDQNAIDVLDRDHQFQCRRLETIEKDKRLTVSMTMQDWFITHTRNTGILSQLIQLMKETPKETVITFNLKLAQFNLVNVRTKQIEHVAAKLSNTEHALSKALERHKKSKNQPEPNRELTTLLATYNLTEIG